MCIDETPRHARLSGCSRCHSVGAKYCNRECQARDWPIHKNFCHLSSAAAPIDDEENSSSSSSSVQALLFPQDSNLPVLVRVKVSADVVSPWGSSILSPNGEADATDFIPGEHGVTIKSYNSEQFPQYHNGRPEYRLDCGFSLYCSTDPSLPENECMKRVLTGHAKAKFGGRIAQIPGMENMWKHTFERQKKWKGPLLVVKTDRYENNRATAPTYEDFEVRDVKYLVLYLGFVSGIAARYG